MSRVGATVGSPLLGSSRFLRRKHDLPRLGHRFPRQGDVHGHLVAVEVSVEGGADQGMNLDRAALDEHRLKRLNAQPVERGGAVQEDGPRLDDIVQHVPDLGPSPLDDAFRALDVVGHALVRPGRA